jgi:hypothetical protein
LEGKKDIFLIRPGADAFASVQVRNETVKVYFQKPTAVLSESEYKEIFNNYNLDVDFRRPDILTVDSAYKVLGYLADFKKTLPKRTKTKSRSCSVVD